MEPLSFRRVMSDEGGRRGGGPGGRVRVSDKLQEEVEGGGEEVEGSG